MAESSSTTEPRGIPSINGGGPGASQNDSSQESCGSVPSEFSISSEELQAEVGNGGVDFGTESEVVQDIFNRAEDIEYAREQQGYPTEEEGQRWVWSLVTFRSHSQTGF